MNLVDIKNNLREWVLGEVVSAQEYDLTNAALSHDPNVRHVGSFFGLYILYRNGEIVYVGKVSGAKVKLRGRMKQHLRKIRLSIVSVEEMTCRMIPVHEKVLILSLEEMLIKELNPPWNGMDFGGNLNACDEAKRVKPSKWVDQYIARLDLTYEKIPKLSTDIPLATVAM